MLVFTSSVLMGCSEEAKQIRDRSQYSNGHIFSYEKGAAIPDRLVSLVESQYVQVYRTENVDSTLSDVEIITGIPRRLLELTVFLREKNS
ncbi:MAG: hypothetical protein AAF202_12640, partial [Pseudomonadota bacterium]